MTISVDTNEGLSASTPKVDADSSSLAATENALIKKYTHKCKRTISIQGKWTLIVLKFFIYFFREKMLMSNDMRNMLLVVSVLLVTIAYQAVLSPPGGFWQDNYIPGTNNQFNITAATSATNEVNQVPHRVGTVTMARHFFHLLVSINTLTFYIPLFLIVLVLPPGNPSALLAHYILWTPLSVLWHLYNNHSSASKLLASLFFVFLFLSTV
jgi:hypothetical protein